MIEIARFIIQAAEDQVLGSPAASKRWPGRLIRGLLVPWLLLLHGFGELNVQAARAVLGAILGGVVGLLLPISQEASRSANVWFLAITGALIALLSTPSDLCRMIDSSPVMVVVQRLRSQGVRSQDQVDTLTGAVALLERRPKAQIAALRWSTGVAWAAAVYAFAQSLASQSDALAMHAYVQLAVVALLAALLLYAITRAYSSPTEQVFEAVYLGLAELRYELAAAESSQALPADAQRS